jgi:hypothetical protein
VLILRHLFFLRAVFAAYVAIFCLSAQAQTLIAPNCQALQPPSPIGNVPPQDFKLAAQKMVGDLLKSGYRKFGQMDLNSFLGEINQTQVNYYPYLTFYQSDGHERASACWALQNGVRTVNVNQWMWARTDTDMRSVIAVHEFLGPARFNDQNYQVSTAMAILMTNQGKPGIEPEQIPALSRLTRSSLSSGGGIVGVGGGGDWIGSLAKLAFFKSGLDDLQHAKTPEERQAALRSLTSPDADWTVEVQWH